MEHILNSAVNWLGQTLTGDSFIVLYICMVCLCEIFGTLSKTVFFYSLNWVPKSYILLECIDVSCVYLYQRFVVITDSLEEYIFPIYISRPLHH